ncbi:MAG: D-alanine--D-alanine ligase, partial [Actinobacteria bacterium]|nr:D-alanine--D-alanine ligase [Actinomycetota bacterium]
MGGRSLEREISLMSGERVCSALSDLGYKVVPLDLTPALV